MMINEHHVTYTPNLTHQLFPPNPKTEIGLHVNPTGVFTPPTTMPNKRMMTAATGFVAVVRVWQHWIGPVLQWEVSVGFGVVVVFDGLGGGFTGGFGLA